MIDGRVVAAKNLDRRGRVRHAFFTRQGGVSAGCYTSLNCGFGSGDERAAVIENRARAARHLNVDHNDIVTAHQCHSADAVVIKEPFASNAQPHADAIVTATPGLAVGVLTADCTPILMADAKAGIAAAAHAGWRGALTGVLESTLIAMEGLGARRADIHAAVGPCIRQPNYEVGSEFQAEFLACNPESAAFFSMPSHASRPHFDLPGYCTWRLRTAAIASIEDIGLCTYEHESLFFSYRRKTHVGAPDYGRQISAIVVT